MANARDLSTWLPNLLGPVDLQANGTAIMPRRKGINFSGNVSAIDDPDYDRVNIVIGEGGGDIDGPTLTTSGTGVLDNIASTSAGVNASGIRFTGAAPQIAGIASGADKRRVVLVATGGDVVLLNEAGSSSTANRILTGTGGPLTIPDESAALLAYDATSQRWRYVGILGASPGGADGSVQVRAGDDFAGVSPGPSGNVLTSNGTAWGSAAPAASGAPLGASYVTIGTDATLPNERALTGGAGVQIVDGGPGGAVTLTTKGATKYIPDSPPIAGNKVDDYDASVAGVPAKLLHVTYAGTLTITSLANPTENREIFILNADDGSFGTTVILDHAAATGTAANRILCPTNADVTLGARSCAHLIYDDGTDRWRLIGLWTTGGAGEVNTSSNTGSGAQLAKAKVGVDLPFRTLVGQNVVGVTQNTNDVGIGLTGGSDGNFMCKVAGSPTWHNMVSYVGQSGGAGNGFVRAANNVPGVYFRDGTNTGDVPGLSASTANELLVGTDLAYSAMASAVRIYGSGAVYVGVAAGATKFVVTSSIVAATATNVSLFDGTGDFDGSQGTVYLKNAAVAPGCGDFPAGGGILFSEASALKWIGGVSGTITTLAPAEPHCKRCGRDFALEYFSGAFDEYLSACVPCLLGALADLGVPVDDFSERRLQS